MYSISKLDQNIKKVSLNCHFLKIKLAVFWGEGYQFALVRICGLAQVVFNIF